MKKHLLFNQSFGTEGSPNQTGETLAPSDERAMTVRRPSDEQRSRIPLLYPCYTFARAWKYVACMLMLLVLSIGQMWGANIFSAVANSSSDLSVSSKSQVQFTAAQATVSGGKMYYTVTGSSNRNILDDSYGPSGNKKKTFCFSGNDQYYSVKLNNTINEGDTIYVEIFADKSLWFTASSVASRPSSAPATATSTGTSGAWTAVKYVIAKNSDLDGVDTLHIWRNSGNTYFSSIWIAQKAASCDAAPTAPTAFAKSSVTSTTATFSITDAAGAASYDIYCSESSTDPTSGTTPTATGITTKTPTVTGLTAGTTYYAWVRAVCDGSHKSSWVALDPTTFTTLAAPTASFSNSTYAIGGSALDLSTLWSSNSAGSVTYSVEDAAGTGASVSTASFSATRAGKAKVKAVQAANGSYDAITKYAYITVGSNVVGKHTVTYDLEVNVDKSRIPVTDSVRSTSLYLTTAEGDTLKGAGLSYTGGQKSGLTGKISAPASYDGNKYVYVQFSIASGYQLTLDSAWCVVQAVGDGSNQNGKLVISDTDSHSFTGSEISCPGTKAGTQTHVVVKGDGSTAFTGTVTLKIYVYGSDATYRLGEKINIHGSVAAAAGATYKLGGSWNDFSEHTMEVSDGVASYSVDLAADTRYEFYLKDNGTTYKSNGTIMAPGGWVFTTGENNAYIHTGPAGTYTFSMNTSTHAVSVTYPSVTHPSDHYVYFKNSDVWGTVHAYLRDDADNKKAAAWPGSPTATTTICGQIYHYAALNGMNGTYTKIQFNDGYAGYGHETSVLSVSGSAAKYNANRDANWYDPAISITFDKNGGTGSMEKIVGLCSGDNKTLPSNTFTRTGWEFDGWNTDKYGGGTPYEDGETIEGITANITLYAQWKKTVYLYSSIDWWYNDNAWFAVYCFDSDADSNKEWKAMSLASCETKVYKVDLPGNGYDKMIIVRKSSDKTLSWTGVHNQTVNIDYPTTNPKYTITSQISGGDDNGKVTGSWGTYSIPTFTISYAGGTAAESGSKSDETKTCEVAFTLPDEAVFSRTGYTQTGWTTSEGAAQTHALGGSYTDNAAQTFYPVWTPKNYDLTWNLGGGTTTSAGTGIASGVSANTTTSQAFGTDLSAPTVTKTGYTFAAWSPDVASTMPASNTTYTATWTAKTTAITLEAGEGGTDGSATATYGTSTITDYVAASRTGYTLDKYQDGSKNNILTKEGELNSGDKGSILDDGLWVYDGATITLYAQWTAIEYTIAYNLAGGSVASPNPTSYTIESSAITLNNPTKTGYTFAGWTGTGLDAATTAVTIAAGSTGNRSYTATWTAIVPSSVSLNKTSTTIEIEGTETLTATISPADVADNTITWTSSDETVATVTSAGVVTGVKAGTATITATTHNDKTATCEVTVAAAVTYTVTYEYNGATSGDETESNNGNPLPNPSKTGYSLVGWYASDGTFAGAGGATTYVPDADITLYAQWQSTSCAGGGGGSTTIFSISGMSWSAYSAENGTITIYPTGTPDETYTATLVGASTVSVVNTNTDGNDKAMLGKNSIKIGGNAVSMRFTLTSGTLQNGDVISFTNSGSNQLSFTTTATRSTTPATTSDTYTIEEGDGLAGSSSLYVWRPGSTPEFTAFTITRAGSGTCYYVTYNGNGADGGFTTDEASHPSGSNVTVKTNGFTKTGYRFTGWKTEPSGGTSYAAGDIISSIAGNMTLYAQWEEEEDETTYYLVTSTAQLNTTDTYVIMDDGKAAMMGVYGEDVMTAITSGFTAATDKSTVTVTSSDVNTLTLQAESSAWNIVGKDDKKLTTNSTVGANLYGNTPKANSDSKDDFVFSFADGKATIKRTAEEDFHIYYTSGTGFNQSKTATNIRLYTSNSTPVDVTAPTLSSSTPANGATGVAVSGNIVLTFSENVTINDASKFTLTGGAGTLNTASASASGAVVTIPYTGLAYNTTYTLATAAEAVKDGSNNKNAAFDITFTTLSATGSCNELNYVWQTGSSYTPKGVSNTYASTDTATIINSNDATTHITISGTNYEQKKGSKGSLNLAKAKDNHFLLTAASGYVIDSVYFYGKLEDGACRMSTDGSAWTTTLGDGSSTGEKVYAIGVGTQYFGLKNNDEDSPAGVWIRTMMVKVCPAGTTYTVNYDANGHGTAPDAETDIDPGSNISAPSAPSADCWTFNGWYKERACTNVWNFAEDEVNSNITLYAKWTSNAARVKSMNYGETNYTVTPEGRADALTVTPVSTTGVTYKWLTNTTDDASTASVVDGETTASYEPSIAAVGTKYYWAVLVHACGNDTTSGIRIQVSAAKTDPTIVWGNVKLGDDDATPTYGGGGYTLTGTINAGADATPTLDASMISADGGIVITDKSVNDASKTFSLTFDMTAAFDTTQAKITNIHFSLPSNSTYNDSVFSTDLSFDKCSGGSYSTDVYVVGYTNATGTSTSSSANKALKVAKSWITTASPSFTDKTSADGFSISATNANCYWKQSNQTIISTTTGATMRMYKVGLKSCTIEWTTSSLSFSKVRIIGRNESADPSTVTVSNGTEEKTFTFAGGKQYELQVQEVSLEFVHGSDKGVRLKGDGAKEISAIIELVPTGSDGAGTGTATTLQWKSEKAPSDIIGWDGEKIVKAQSDDGFTCVAEQTSATNSVGAITYASDNTDVATVNETTGEVDIVAGAAGGEATITATMARSGCFMRSTISYTISVDELECAIEPGTLTASATSKCTAAEVTLTLSDYTTAGTTLQWYKSGTAAPLTDGSTYDIEGATMTTAEAGTYYVKVTLESGCSLTSNNVTITNKGGAASVSKLVNQWYIKKGRVTPDIALWRLGEGSSYVANSAKAGDVALTDQLGGCTVIARDSTIYLSGGDPTGISAVGDVSLTVQVRDECGNTTTSDTITIHKQVATDKHELAFVTTGTNYEKKEFTEDAWTAGIKAANSTGLALYQVLKDTFKIQATNIYASDDEKKIREYYSQYDLICITDYPNTSTKGKNRKSYVDAIGSLIDIRPVLTMEAWVSGLDNWRNKGAVGTRTTPSKRQYNMYLQCKDHEMFEGVTMQQIGYGDDALFKVNMVDSTQSRYTQLDAVGKDSHATDTAALQGFTTGDMDLLAIGLIDNGSGTNLQVGAERQNVMTARMMILGVNSYAMERLSEDGMRIIVNALQYLTKKRAEDISDCSTYFTNAAGDSLWENPANWRSGTLPYSNQEARILQPVVVSDTRKIASVKIVADGTFQDAEARGHLTIAPTGALIVNSVIQSATGPDVFSGYPTEISHLTIQTDELHQGALIFDNSNGETQATVNLNSKAYNDGSYKFQYFASPFMDLSSWAFDAYIYTHDESLDTEWTQLRYGEDVSAFQGLAITADGDARNYTIDGTLASTNPHTFNLTYTSGKANNKKGSNVIGNSWSAPIQITRIDDSDFSSPSNFEGIIYIYNAGRDVLVADKVYASDGNSEPGQWQSIPVALAKEESWEHKRQIPAFQAFQMKVNAATEFTLDYDKHVRQEASVGANNYNEPLHAPSRSMRAEEVKVLRLCVEDAQVGKSYIYLCEGDEFTEERDRGWEAKQTVGSGKYGKLYAIDQARDYMMSIARPSLEGTPVGFICGQSTEYTISFNETDGTYYLNDLEKQQSTLIQEGESYTFTTTKGNHPNRFIISATPFEAPSVATGMTNLDAAAPKVQKIIYNDKLYIIRGGKVYSADGQVVK